MKEEHLKPGETLSEWVDRMAANERARWEALTPEEQEIEIARVFLALAGSPIRGVIQGGKK